MQCNWTCTAKRVLRNVCFNFLLYRPLTWFGQNHCLIKQSVHSDSLDVRHSKTLSLRLPNSWSISPHERESGLWNRKNFGFRSFEIQDIRSRNQQSVARESIQFFRLKFLVSPAEKNRLRKRAEKKSARFRKRFFSGSETRNLRRKTRMLSQAISSLTKDWNPWCWIQNSKLSWIPPLHGAKR